MANAAVPQTPGSMSRRKKIALIAGAGTVVTVGVLLLLVPTIASSLASGIIESQAAKQIAGSVKVGSVSVSWTGPTKITGIELLDDKGQKVGTLEASSSLGILSVLGGLSDLGTTTISGSLEVVQTAAADGTSTTNLQRAIAPRTPAAPSTEPAKFPGDLRAELVVDALTITTTQKDAAGATLRSAKITGLKGTAGAAGRAVGGDRGANAKANFKGAIDGGGTFELSLDATGLTDTADAVRIDGAKVDLSVKAAGVPSAMLDALTGQGGLVAGALGPSVQNATLSVRGGLKDAQASFDVASDNTAASGEVRIAGGRATLVRAIDAQIKDTTFATNVPALRDALQRAGVTVQSAPDVRVSIATLDVALPSGAAGLDLRGAKIAAEVRVGQTQAQVRVPEIGGTPAAPGVAASTGAAATAGVPRVLVIRPASISLTSDDLGGTAALNASTSVAIDGTDAGALAAQVQAGGLLLPGGGPRTGLPGTLSGTVSATRLSTQVLQTFVAGMDLPIDLPTDLGPTLDLRLVANSAAGSAEATDLNLTLASDGVNARSALRLSAERLTTRDDSTMLSVRSISPIARRVLARGGQAPADIRGDGSLTVNVASLDVPLRSGAPVLNEAAANVTVTLGAVDVEAFALAGGPVSISGTSITVDQKPGAPAGLRLATAAARGGERMVIDGDLTVAGILDGDGGRAALPAIGTRRVSGSLSVAGASWAWAEPMATKLNEDMRRLAAEVVGTGRGVNLTFTGAADAQGLTLRADGAASGAALAASLKADRIDVASVDAGLTLTPAMLDSALAIAGFSPQDRAQVRATGGRRVSVAVAPMSIPLAPGSLSPAFDRAGDAAANAKITLDALVLSDLNVAGRRLSAGARSVNIDASLPLAALGPSGGSRRATVKVSAELLRSEDAPLGTLSVDAAAALDQSFIKARAGVTGVSTLVADEVLGRPGFVSGLLGSSASLEVSVDQASAGAARQILLGVVTPNVNVQQINIVVDDQAIRLASPMSVRATVPAAWAEQNLLGGSTPGATSRTRIERPIELTADVRSLAIATKAGPLLPGVFAIDAQGTIRELALRQESSGSPGVASTLEGLSFSAATTPDNALNANVRIASVREGGAATEPIVADVRVAGIGDPQGNFDRNGARVNLDFKTGNIPTAIIDGLANQGGELVKLVGPAIMLEAQAAEFSLGGSGSAYFSLRSKHTPPSAATDVRAVPAGPAGSTPAAPPVSITPMALIQLATREQPAPLRPGPIIDTRGVRPLLVELSQFSYSVDTKLLKMFPLFANIERKPGPTKTSITSRNLVIPADGDMRRLNGELLVDIGKIDYTFKRELGEFLDTVVFTAAGEAQRPIAPFTISIVNGVMTYDKFDLPIRNFVIKTRGTVDLVNNTVDVIMYVPTVAAAPSVMRKLNADLGSGFGSILPDVIAEGTMVPIRSRGPIDNPTISIDVELFFKEFGNSLTKEPGKIIDNIGRGLGDIFGPKR